MGRSMSMSDDPFDADRALVLSGLASVDAVLFFDEPTPCDLLSRVRPQLYVKGEFVGGCDIIREMFQAGELQQLFADKGIPVDVAA